jgi:tetratricopeptide (TPR) repeat protein
MGALEEVVARGAGRFDVNMLLAEQGLAEGDLLDGEPACARARLEPWAHLEAGEVERALELIEPVVADARAQGTRVRLADALRILALVQLRRGQHAAAAEALDEACSYTRSIPYPWAEAKALYVYGQLHTAKHEPQQAREKYEQALAICDRLGEGMYRLHIERDLAALRAH